MPPPGLYDSCPHCQQAVPAEAWVCSYCRGDLAIDVVLAPVPDPRERYRLARLLAEAGPPFPAFARLQQVLAQPAPRLAGRVTRAAGFEYAGALEARGVRFELVPSRAPGPSGGVVAGLLDRVGGLSGRGQVLGALALLGLGGVLLAGLAFLWASRPLGTSELGRLGQASTVVVTSGSCTGSGFFVSPTGVLTNAHVLCAPEAPVGVGRWQGRLKRSEPGLDIALVEVSGDARGVPLPLGDAGALEPGDPIVLVGAPLGMQGAVHVGRVSNPHQPLMGVTYLQLDANVNPGNSGGPLLNRRGEVVGIVTAAVRDARHIGLALPINYAFQEKDFVVPPRLRDWRGLMRKGPRLFLERVEEAKTENRKEVERFARSFRQPGLVFAAVGPSGTAVAVLLRRAPFDPGGSYRVSVRRGNLPLCESEVAVSAWRPFAADEDLAGSLLGAWIADNGLANDLFVGPAEVPLRACRGLQPGDRMTLSGADPEAPEATLEPPSSLR